MYRVSPSFNLHQSNAAMRRRLTVCAFERFSSCRASSVRLPPHCSLGMSQRTELWTPYLPVNHIVASRASWAQSPECMLVGAASPSPFEHTASRVSWATCRRVPGGIIDHDAVPPARFHFDCGQGSIRGWPGWSAARRALSSPADTRRTVSPSAGAGYRTLR